MIDRISACPICKANGLVPFQHVSERALVICPECRHITWDAMPTPAELDEYYQSHYTASCGQESIQESAREYYRAHVAELLDRAGCQAHKSTMLDFGCSFPSLLEEAAGLGVQTPIGVEPDRTARQRGAELGIQMHSPNDFEREIPDRSVHIARFSHVLEHLTDPVSTLAAVVRKLRKGGLVHITQPSFPVLRAKACGIPLRDCDWPTHLHYFNALSLRVLAERSGLRVVTLFTHQLADDAVSQFAPALDTCYAAEKLRNVRDLGDGIFGLNANYPLYAGENSALYATRDRPSS